MKKISLLLTLTLACAFMHSCKNDRQEMFLSSSLSLAADNRAELQKVLNHYSLSATDSLKLKAARYLISNMVNKHTASSAAIESYAELIPEIAKVPADEGLGSPRIGKLFEEFRKTHPQASDTRITRTFDLQSVSADYLIKSIDDSFAAWEKAPWSKHYSFDVFCEYILPYRSMMEGLSDWKYAAYKNPLWWKPTYDTITDPVRLCDSLFRKIDLIFEGAMSRNYAVPQSYPTLLASHWGDCVDEANYAVFQMRANAVPVAVDFVPHWASIHSQHSWNVVIDTTGRSIDFQVGFRTSPGDVKLREKVAKIYRHTFTIQRDEITYKRLGKEDIPPVFRGCTVIDVTDTYGIPTVDVKIELKSIPKDTEILYLCVSSYDKWIPTAYAHIKGKTAVFKNVATGVIDNDDFNDKEKNLGSGIVLLPAFYKDGDIVPAGDAFVLNPNGEQIAFTNQNTEKETITLDRKMRQPYRFDGFADQLEGGYFEGSNSPNFSNAMRLATVKAPVQSYLQMIEFDSQREFRYVRFVANEKYSATLGELKFYDQNGDPLQGLPIGSLEKHYFRPVGNAFDGDIVSFYASKDIGGWIGLDLGKPTKVTSVAYCPRTTGNHIEIGEEYTLYYWNGKWCNIDTKKADSRSLTFDNVPKGALLLLINKTQGKEHRIFTYHNDNQVWW